jgi:hypothetical protein
MEIIQTVRKDCALIRKSTHAIVHIHGMSLWISVNKSTR